MKLGDEMKPGLVQCATCGKMMPDEPVLKATHRQACVWVPKTTPWWNDPLAWMLGTVLAMLVGLAVTGITLMLMGGIR